jgi:3-hydroxy acid dehydrogenase/malonic semialdehyde reductase
VARFNSIENINSEPLLESFDISPLQRALGWLVLDSLKGRIVLITGASSGIGAACARVFGKNGARLILNARRKELLVALASELRKHHGTTSLISHFDVRDFAQVKNALEQLPVEWQAVDILVNNAGLARGLDVLYEGHIEDWDEMVDTNVKGLLYVTRMVVPGMVKRRRGHVVNIASIAGFQTYPKGNVYCASKAAVRVISEGLKQDLTGTPIRVTAISPGLVETEFAEVRFRGDKQRATKTYSGLTPLVAEDVADAVYFCVTRPPHVNINEIVLMPTDQSSTTLAHRRSST